MKECADWWVYALLEEWNNNLHVPTEQNMDPVSQRVPLIDRDWRLIANLCDDADFTPQVI